MGERRDIWRRETYDVFAARILNGTEVEQLLGNSVTMNNLALIKVANAAFGVRVYYP
jgi:hypothetical protein